MLDILIIGAGPTGLYAAFLSGLRKLKCSVIDSAGTPGGQLTAIYGDKYIYDIPGFYKITANDYISELVKQYNRFKDEITIYYNNEAISIIKHTDHYEVITNEQTFLTKYILIAHGGGGFVPQRIKTEKEFDNVLYFVKNQKQFSNKKVLVLGGGDSALDWALSLTKHNADVTIVHRREQFRALPMTVELFKSKGTVLTPYLVSDLIGEGSLLNSVLLKHIKDGTTISLDVDYVLVNYGFVYTKSRLHEWGIEGDKGSIKVDTTMETNLNGVYAAGNGVSYPGKVKLISTGQGEASIAVESIYHRLHPDRAAILEHSTILISE